MQDIVLLNALGVKVVLVAGCRSQINDRLVAAVSRQPAAESAQEQTSHCRV